MAWKVMMPKKIMFGENAAKEFPYPNNALVITTTTPDIYNKWLDYMGIKDYEVYDKVTPDPAIETFEDIQKGYDSKLANPFTKFFCKEAFDILEDGIINDKHHLLPYGAMLSGIGFGNASTTLGHALSYAFSNEGIPHGYALSSCTTVAHKFNKSTYYERFKRICQKLKFEPLKLTKPLDQAADDIMPDRGHLDNNPIPVTKQDVIKCLEEIVTGNPLA